VISPAAEELREVHHVENRPIPGGQRQAAERYRPRGAPRPPRADQQHLGFLQLLLALPRRPPGRRSGGGCTAGFRSFVRADSPARASGAGARNRRHQRKWCRRRRPRGWRLAEVANVLVVQIHVDEAAHFPLVGEWNLLLAQVRGTGAWSGNSAPRPRWRPETSTAPRLFGELAQGGVIKLGHVSKSILFGRAGLFEVRQPTVSMCETRRSESRAPRRDTRGRNMLRSSVDRRNRRRCNRWCEW